MTHSTTRALSTLVLLVALCAPGLASAQGPAGPSFEVGAELIPFSIAGTSQSDAKNSVLGAGLGAGLTVRRFNAAGHGFVGGLRIRAMTDLCILCSDPDTFNLWTVSAGYGYQVKLTHPSAHRVWWDFTPHVSAQAGAMTPALGSSAGVVGGNVGFDFNLHTRRGFFAGIGGTYEPLVNTATGDFIQGGGAMLRRGGAFDLGN
ncbi:MAG: hypothetical protein KC543_10680 [Myxococcales bacterium]|nr:hypothetical protein [Myxococcales bacterium]